MLCCMYYVCWMSSGCSALRIYFNCFMHGRANKVLYMSLGNSALCVYYVYAEYLCDIVHCWSTSNAICVAVLYRSLGNSALCVYCMYAECLCMG